MLLPLLHPSVTFIYEATGQHFIQRNYYLDNISQLRRKYRQRTKVMRKLFFMFFMLSLYLSFPAPARSEFYVIRLTNGGAVATPLYWSQGGQVHFFYAGGTVGVEKETIERVEKHQGERDFSVSFAADTKETKELPPLSAATEKASGSEKPPLARMPEEKVNIADYKSKKDQLTVELDGLMEKMDEANRGQDYDVKEKIKEQIRAKTILIYKITDEVTEKNKGKLPEGWWKK